MNNKKLDFFTSTSYLLDHCDKIIDNEYICLTKDVKLENISSTENAEVVFFGDMIEFLPEIHNLNYKNIHINVLCARYKKVLVDLFRIPKEYISVLSKEIIVKEPKVNEIPRVGESWTLIYGGRLSNQKNIPLLIQTVFYLQELYNEKVELVLMGEYDQSVHFDHLATQGRSDIEYRDIESWVNDLIENLPWRYKKPSVHTGLGAEEWPKKKFVNPVFISLSTSLQEDFGYAVKQANDEGYPLILTNWGGFESFKSANFLPVSSSYIFHNPLVNSKELIQGIALSYSRMISERDFVMNDEEIDEKITKNYIGVEELLKVINENLNYKKLKLSDFRSHSAKLQAMEDPSSFNYRNFFDDYREILSGGYKPGRSISIIAYPFEKHEWTSMNEIIPCLMTMWLSTFGPENDFIILQNNFFNKKSHINYYLKILSKSIRTIILRMDPREITFIRFVHAIVKSSNQLVIHLHENAPYHGWNFYRTKVDQYFKAGDLFIGSCSKDEKSFRLGYEKSNYLELPFILQDTYRLRGENKNKVNRESGFVYIGRVSELKNIHVLLMAFGIYKNKYGGTRKLYIFGKYDQLGNPLTGSSYENYEGLLKNILIYLNITDSVVFEGFLEQSIIFKKHIHPNDIYTSASVHPDENFGVAPYLFLANGGRAVLSRIGGLVDYISHFPESVLGISVFGTTEGPKIDPNTFAKKLIQSEKLKRVEPAIFDKYFNIKLAKSKMLEALNTGQKEKAFASTFLEESYKDCQDPILYSRKTSFKNYKDNFMYQTLKLYTEHIKDERIKNEGSIYLMPWVETSETEYIVKNPSMDLYTIRRGSKNRDKRLITFGNEIKISDEDIEVLNKHYLIYTI